MGTKNVQEVEPMALENCTGAINSHKIHHTLINQQRCKRRALVRTGGEDPNAAPPHCSTPSKPSAPKHIPLVHQLRGTISHGPEQSNHGLDCKSQLKRSKPSMQIRLGARHNIWKA